jgi:hypothetical protein
MRQVCKAHGVSETRRRLLQANWTVGTASYSVKSEYPALSEAQDRQFVLLAQKNYCPNV